MAFPPASGAAAKHVLAHALKALFVTSVVFEPARLALHPWLRDHVGGVGGVGGLANLWSGAGSCVAASGAGGDVFDDDDEDDDGTDDVLAPTYCFHRGVLLGMTPFALVMVVAWVAPMLWLASRARKQADDGSVQFAPRHRRHRFWRAWLGASAAWFFVPFATFASSPFYWQSPARAVLAVAIPAAFPLSWHLALVAVPMGPFTRALVSWSREDVAWCHARVGASTLCWAALHVTGEVSHLVLSGKGGAKAELDLSATSESLLYYCGMVTALLLAAHGAVSAVRRWSERLHSRFHDVHGVLAAAVLLMATCHWWPFVFFLLPAISVHATTFALVHSAGFPRDYEPGPGVPVPAPALVARVLSFGLTGAFVGMVTVWLIREESMCAQARPDLTMLPFVLPAASLVCAFGVAFLFAHSFLCLRTHEPDDILIGPPEGASAHLHMPLLD